MDNEQSERLPSKTEGDELNAAACSTDTTERASVDGAIVAISLDDVSTHSFAAVDKIVATDGAKERIPMRVTPPPSPARNDSARCHPQIRAPWSRGPQTLPKQSLLDIMQEEEKAASRALAEEEDIRVAEEEQEEQLIMLAMEMSMKNLHEPHRRMSHHTAADDEDEMMRLAMERSLADMHGTTSQLNNNAMQGSSREFAMLVQEESEITERFVETPTISRRKIVAKRPSQHSQHSLTGSQRSLASASSSVPSPTRSRFNLQPELASPAMSEKHIMPSSPGAKYEPRGGHTSDRKERITEDPLIQDPSNLIENLPVAVNEPVASVSKVGVVDTGDIVLDHVLGEASQYLSVEELDQIARALRESELDGMRNSVHDSNDDMEDSKPCAGTVQRGCDSGVVAPHETHISVEDTVAIERALREAEEEDERKSLELALKILQEENMVQQSSSTRRVQQGNVRTMTRAELRAERTSQVGAFHRTSPPRMRHPLEEAEEENVSAGFRMNAGPRQQWSRRDQSSVIGPNNEIRTKHDTVLQGRANAHRLGLDTNHSEGIVVGNKAYNDFMSSVRRTNKGVAAHGTGRAGSDADGTKGGAMDPGVRLQITRAINNAIIDKCNGVVKEGKEAVIYHADGTEHDDFDVAIKVFKRIQEFRARGDYVNGDPRYRRDSFKSASPREQLSLWAEKEFRNLIRANRAGVPVPYPISVRENVLFMRFIGTEGWPCPQLRELNLRRGSEKWATLYHQVMMALKGLYQRARLVHADLSEYNIMVGPAALVENHDANIEDENEELQAIIIDFGQAVDAGHPEAYQLLERDIDRVQTFFRTVGVEVMDIEDVLDLVVGPRVFMDKVDDDTTADKQEIS